MKKSITLILAVLILVVLIVVLIFTNNKTPQEEASTSSETNPSSESPSNDAAPESMAKVTISGTEFASMTIGVNDEQNGIITAYDLTTDTLDRIDVSNNSFDKLVNALPDFTVGSLIADHVTDLSAYGLDQPKLHLIIEFYDSSIPFEEGTFPATTTTLDFIWGNELEDGKIAFMRTGETSVYAMDASFLPTLKELATPFSLSSKFIELPKIQNVKAIDIAYADATYHIDVDEANASYTLNNKSIEKDAFKALYRSVIGIYAEAELEDKSDDTTLEVTITYTMQDGSTRAAIFTKSNNSQYYQTMLHGSMIVGCSQAQLSNLKTTLDEALNESTQL